MIDLMKTMKQWNNETISRPGFTLLEILLVVAIIGILAGVGVPVYQSFQVKNDVTVAQNIIAQTARRAQVLAQAVDSDTTWGVYIQVGSITLFQGADYATRDTSYDEFFDIANSITPSGINEIVFSKLDGEPNNTGNIILTSVNDNVKSLNINSKGIIEY